MEQGAIVSEHEPLQSRGSMRCHREEKKAGWCHQRPCESLRSCRRWLLSAARHSHRQPTPHPYSFLGNKYILCRTYRLQSSIPLARLQQLDQMKKKYICLEGSSSFEGIGNGSMFYSLLVYGCSVLDFLTPNDKLSERENTTTNEGQVLVVPLPV